MAEDLLALQRHSQDAAAELAVYRDPAWLLLILKGLDTFNDAMKPAATGPGRTPGNVKGPQRDQLSSHTGSSEKSLPGPANLQPKTLSRESGVDTEGSHERRGQATVCHVGVV